MTTPPGPTASAIDAKAEPKKITEGHKFKVKATVTTASGVPTGTVQVYKGTKLLGTGTLKSNGKVTIKISEKKAKKLKVGKNTLTAKYLGSATVAPSQDDFVIKVKKKSASHALTAGLQGAGRTGTSTTPGPAGPCSPYATDQSRQNGFPAGSA